MAPNPPQVAKARLYSLKDESISVTVHFNPTSLVYSVESATPQAPDPNKRQFAAQFTGKLTMDLQFDTTDTGDDVRTYTNKVAYFLQPSSSATQGAAAQTASPSPSTNATAPPKAPPVVCFEWGVYRFQGVMETFRETIDFFSAEGVPLRAAVSIGLARQDQVFDEGATMGSSKVSGSLVPTSAGSSALSMATLGGDPGAARQLATQNGLSSLRFTGGALLNVSGGVQLKAAAGFAASASGGVGAGIGFGAGAGGGLGIGGGIGGSAGIATSGSAGISTGGGPASGKSFAVSASAGPLFGSTASAGVAASAGAFAGLESGRAKVSTTARLDPMRMLRATVGADVSTFNGASFSLGGAANNTSSAGFSADVGAKFSFRDRLTFDNDD